MAHSIAALDRDSDLFVDSTRIDIAELRPEIVRSGLE